ncbi:hypothetical protein N0V88_002109 [Collariella sp. IMI 366227]|nr:hypothetical protein N0V88_002109 [Collariella sp. IMI 366227]
MSPDELPLPDHELALQLQAEELGTLKNGRKGKAPEGETDDLTFAIKLYEDELAEYPYLAADRYMCGSIAQAVKLDGDAIRAIMQEEEQANSDRVFASSLNPQGVPPETASPVSTVPDLDEQLLARFEALYLVSPEEHPPESSAWAASRPTLRLIDIPERNQQVAIMRDIYRSANRTVVWLGPKGNHSNEALAIIPDLLAVKEKFHGGGHRAAPVGVRSRFMLSAEEVEAIPELQRLIANTDSLAAFLTLLQRQWFSRVWVVQEVTVSLHTIVKCGSVEVSFDNLAQAAITFDYLDLHVGVGLRRPLDLFWDIWDTRRKHWDRWANSMFQILLRHRWCQATDPRDKVYALCGIATDAMAEQQRYGELLAPGWYQIMQPSPLAVVVDRPDYNVPTVGVYTQLASKLLMSDLGLDLFSAIHPSVPRLAGLPSWVPDWSTTEWNQNFRKSSKNTFFDLEQQNTNWSGMMEDSPPGPSVPPKEMGFVLKGAFVGAERDIVLTKKEALRTEYIRSFQACGDSKPNIRISDPPEFITLSGMVIDVLEEVGDSGPKPTADAAEVLNSLAAWAEIAQRAVSAALAQALLAEAETELARAGGCGEDGVGGGDA